eukprot:jgi/Chlat1/8493/Chrsp80S07891
MAPSAASAAVLGLVGTAGAFWLRALNTVRVRNLDTLLRLVRARPPDTPLLTVSNHMSTLDDPLMWQLKGMPRFRVGLVRWVLAAEDICFTNPLFATFFRLGKCIPVRRGAGVHQPGMVEAVEKLDRGEWVHTFVEGRVSPLPGPLQRIKWGVGSLVARTTAHAPIVLPLSHAGFEKIMPETSTGAKPWRIPRIGQRVSISVGEPLVLDTRALRLMARDAVADGLPHIEAGIARPKQTELPGASVLEMRSDGDVAARVEAEARWIYKHVTDRIEAPLRELTEQNRQWHTEWTGD